MRSLLARLDAIGSGRLTATLLLLSLVALRMLNPPFLEILQLRGFDLMQQLAPEQRRDIVVKVVDIDEKSLRALGQWPWPRDTMAELIMRVGQAGAVVIGMDIVLAEPDRTSPARLAERLGEERPDMSALLRALPDHDRVLAGILSRSRIVLGQTGVPDAGSGAARRSAIPSFAVAVSMRMRCSPLATRSSQVSFGQGAPRTDPAVAAASVEGAAPTASSAVR
ncbi:MAG: CHASE2 domain-containing protein [Alphaproteobacteria bacterium]